LHKDLFTKGKIESMLMRTGFQVVAIQEAIFRDEPFPVSFNVEAMKPVDWWLRR
jgi:hypothetical protein